MALEVIGAGFGRTGTLSMKVALERLGYERTHHMRSVVQSSRQTALWHEVGTTAARPWDEIFAGFAASVDFPSATWYSELLAHYPQAKVVLTTRDVDRWYESTASTIFAIRELTPQWAIRLVPPLRRRIEMTDATVWDRVFDGRFADRYYATQVFVEHLANVKATVPSERLLVFEVADGWEPLCAFLDCEVPNEPFPHVNSRATFQRQLAMVRLLVAVPYAAAAALALRGGLAVRRRPR